jgi:Ser/Thr protein kinase RdoA (MazF antagonist)
MATTPLNTEKGLRVYLETQSVEPKDITLLTGGTANFVYRVSLPDGKTVIYKHAAPYLHSNTNFAFNPIRMDYESHALETLPPLLSRELPQSKVHPAGWHSYDKEAKLLCIEDGGSQNLKAAYADPKLDIAVVGKELGEWIATLHLSSTQASLSLTNSSDLEANNPIASIYRHSYQNLHTALSEYGHDASLGIRINEEFGSLLATENECICHGDFWTGNVLVKFSNQSNDVNFTIVDWEMVRRGISATDVAQFAAESFLSDRFNGGRGLRKVFLNAYLEAREKSESEKKMDRKWVIRMVVHWATHIAFWPTRVQGWTDREGTQKLVDIGVDVLKAALSEDWERLQKSELFAETNSAWSDVWQRT